MAEQAAPPTTASPSTTAEDAATLQARRRKERREAKIRAGASSRLNKISGLAGGLQRDDPAPAKVAAAEDADPDEVDISEHFYQPATTQRIPGGGSDDDAQRRQLQQMQQMQQLFGAQPGGGVPGGAAASNPFLDGSGLFGPGPGLGAGPDGGAMGAADDPMAMLNQMMQSMGGGPFPPGFPGAFPGAPAASTAPDTSAATYWRIVHAAVALALGFYAVLATPFTGTRAERELYQQDVDAAAELERQRRYFFYAFASAETVLLTTRYLLEGSAGLLGGSGGGGGVGGLVSMAINFLPPGVQHILQLVQRCWQIFSTVRTDLVLCVFVLGVCSWWQG